MRPAGACDADPLPPRSAVGPRRSGRRASSHGPAAEGGADAVEGLREPRDAFTYEEVDEINARCGPVRPYMGPVLSRKRPAYIALVRRLLKAGLVRLSTAHRCQVGVLFVWKKGDRQRLILGRRPANRLFRSPSGVDL
eukprot:7785441-Pyramimonas_sp.AAC.1